jgi:hypothetical protein
VTAIQSHRHLAAFAKFMLPRIPISYRPMQGAIALAETATALLQGKGAGSGWNMDAEIRAHRRFIRSQCPVLFDVGANVGEWSNAVTKRLGGNVQLWMFEPQEACREYLEPLVDRGVGICTSSGRRSRWLYRSVHTRRSVRNCLPLSASGHVLQRYPIRSAASQDHHHRRLHGAARHPVRRFHEDDIEGHELAALAGATKALKSKTIGALSFEFGSGNVNSRTYFHDFWDLLSEHGYSVYRILPSGRALRIERYDENLEYFRGVSNYVAAA